MSKKLPRYFYRVFGTTQIFELLTAGCFAPVEQRIRNG